MMKKLLHLLLCLPLIFVSCKKVEAPISGCKDPSAANYNYLAEIDNGSCVYTKAIITVIDINDNIVEDAKVRLHQDGQISTSGLDVDPDLADEKWTNSNGQTVHIFQNEAILNVDVSKWVGTNELTGTNVIMLLKGKTVNKTIEID